jgi:hypothetical protein
MKRPINFEKIDRIDFDTMGITFYIDLDRLQNKEQSSWIWVFPNGSALGDYVVLFELKWEHDCFSMKKCVMGEGTTGDYIFQDNLLKPNFVKTKNFFVKYIANCISTEIRMGTFQN